MVGIGKCVCRSFAGRSCSVPVAGILHWLPNAGAASELIGQDSFRDGEYTFTKCECSMGLLGTNGVVAENNYYYPKSTAWELYSYHSEDRLSFSDGMLLVWNSSDQKEYYLDDQGKIHDLNRGRFAGMYPFSDGRAAVVDKNNKVGYIDTEGNLVIPCQYDALIGQSLDPYISCFEDGYAWVLEYDEGLDPKECIFNGDNLTGTYRKIDKDGNIVPGSDTPVSSEWVIPQDEVVDQFHLMISVWHSPTINDALIDTSSEEYFQTYNSPQLGSFRARFGTSDTGIAILWTGEKDSVGNPINTYAYVVKRNQVADTEFTYGQSTIQEKGYTVVNRNGYLLVDVINNTDKADEGDLFYIYYLKYNEKSGSVDSTTEYLPAGWIVKAHYQLEPHQSKTVRIYSSYVNAKDQEQKDDFYEQGVRPVTHAKSSRILLVQAESREEGEELTEFLKQAPLAGPSGDYIEDINGNTLLANVFTAMEGKTYLDQKFGAFTSQF